VNGVSKTYAMTGWRIGYGGGPKPLINAIRKMHYESILIFAGQVFCDNHALESGASIFPQRSLPLSLPPWALKHARRIIRYLPRRSDAPEHRHGGVKAAGKRRLRGRGAAHADLLRPAGL
jgi:hypothetical protein